MPLLQQFRLLNMWGFSQVFVFHPNMYKQKGKYKFINCRCFTALHSLFSRYFTAVRFSFWGYNTQSHFPSPRRTERRNSEHYWRPSRSCAGTLASKTGEGRYMNHANDNKMCAYVAARRPSDVHRTTCSEATRWNDTVAQVGLNTLTINK